MIAFKIVFIFVGLFILYWIFRDWILEQVAYIWAGICRRILSVLMGRGGNNEDGN